MKSSQRISEQIEERMLSFSVKIIETGRILPKTAENEIIKKQLVRSSSSIGANYIEANNAASKSDFRNKIFIAKKETAETKYWLNLLTEIVSDKDTCLKLAQECHYLLMTFQKIINTLNQGKTVKV